MVKVVILRNKVAIKKLGRHRSGETWYLIAVGIIMKSKILKLTCWDSTANYPLLIIRAKNDLYSKEMCQCTSEGQTTQAQMVLIVTNLIMTLTDLQNFSELQLKCWISGGHHLIKNYCIAYESWIISKGSVVIWWCIIIHFFFKLISFWTVAVQCF